MWAVIESSLLLDCVRIAFSLFVGIRTELHDAQYKLGSLLRFPFHACTESRLFFLVQLLVSLCKEIRLSQILIFDNWLILVFFIC